MTIPLGMNRNTMEQHITWILPVFLLLFGAAMTWAGVRTLRTARASRHWPSVEGVIRRSELVTATVDGCVEHYAEIDYEYQVSGRRFESSQVVHVDVYPHARSHAERRLARFPKGAVVPVYYDPHNAGDSILLLGSRETMHALILVGVFFVIGGAVLAIYLG